MVSMDLYLGRNTALSRFPAGVLTGIFILVLCIMPASAYNMTDIHMDSAIGSHPWVEQFPGIPDRHLNLTVNSTSFSGTIGRSSHYSYEQLIEFYSDARITEAPHGGSVIPADRIIRSSASFTNLSENLTIGVSPSLKYPLTGPGDPAKSLSIEKISRFPVSIDYILIGVINPGYAINEGLSSGIPNLRRSYPSNNDNRHVEFDHRQGFFSTPANSSFFYLICYTDYHNFVGTRTYPYPGPASFTYSYTVDYCTGDPLPGFCPSGVKRLTQTIRFSRAAQPEEFYENSSHYYLSAHDYPFAMTGSTIEVEDVR